VPWGEVPCWKRVLLAGWCYLEERRVGASPPPGMSVQMDCVRVNLRGFLKYCAKGLEDGVITGAEG